MKKTTRLEKAYNLYKEEMFELHNNPKYENLNEEEHEILCDKVTETFKKELFADLNETTEFCKNTYLLSEIEEFIPLIVNHFQSNELISIINDTKSKK